MIAATAGHAGRIATIRFRCMNRPVLEEYQPVCDADVGAIRRRHIIYVGAYDPRGPRGYFDLFRRTCERFQRLWPIALTLQPLEIDSEDFAHWHVVLRGSDWQTTTRFDFLRMETQIRADMAQPTATQLRRALAWLVDDVFSGALFRIFRASWRFGLHLLCFQLLTLGWIAAAAALAAIVGHAVGAYLGWPIWAAVVSSLVAMVLVLLALRPLADRWRVVLINSSWALIRKFARSRPTWLDHAIDVGARRVIAVARSTDADEIAVVGHSSGAVASCAIMARALELDPDLCRDGPRLVLLTLGSVMPAAALHPRARRMREAVKVLASAPNLSWIDCQCRKDVMCFADFDPVRGCGIDIGAQHRNPQLWRISFRDMIAPQKYNRFRRNFFRMHYQFIMAGDRPAPYDYILLVAGPAPITEWPRHDRKLMAAFGDATSAKGVLDVDLAPQSAMFMGAAKPQSGGLSD
jgi:hypothetical protein